MTASTGPVSDHPTRPRWAGITSTMLVAITAFVLVAVTALAFVGLFGLRSSIASPAIEDAPAVVRSQGDATPVAEATPVASYDCEIVAPGVGSEAWVRSELYFGVPLVTPGEMLSEEELQAFLDTEWQDFLDTEITPRFPDGLTVLTGYGQFLNSSGDIFQEDSIVLIIFLPLDAVPTASVSIDEIREAYKAEFDQESVLRADSEPVCISF